MHVVVMAGGSGTRFWPLSRRRHPKQLIRLFGDRAMIAETVARFEGVVPPERVLVVTSEALADPIADALPEVPRANLLLEPMGRNTAPCIGMAAIALRERTGRSDEVMAVFPADHYIRDVEAFRAAVQAAVDHAATGSIVTLGIEPTKPETGYGYIRCGAPLSEGVRRAAAFVEKPDRATAEAYLRSGDYLWNSGMFCFRVDTILSEIARQLPGLASHLDELAPALARGDRDEVARVFAEIEPVSIDYGVMEGASDVAVIPSRFGWDDVGHWDALPHVCETDDAANVIKGDVVAIDCKDSVLFGRPDRVLAAVGLDHFVVVDTEDALLVAPRDRVQQVRAIVEALRARGGELV